MLSCGKVIGQLSKITRHAHQNSINQTSKSVAISGLNHLRYTTDSQSKKPLKPAGTTLKAEECIPKANPNVAKQTTPAAPVAPIPPGCPVTADGTRPPHCEDICGPIPPRRPGDKGPNWLLQYWKQLLAALIITGTGFYVLDRSQGKESTTTTKSKKKKEKEKGRKREKIKSPATSSSIPSEVPYLLIGGGTAAFSAFRSIKSRDPKAKVLVITEESTLPYMRPPLSKELWYSKDRVAAALLNFRQWNGTQRSLFYEPPEFYAKVEHLAESDKGGVAIASGWKVTKIDPYKKIAVLEDGYEIKYDKCLVATGALPKNLPVFEAADDVAASKIIAFRTKEDFLDLEENVNKSDVQNIVIIGGGFLGSELACSLARNLEGTTKRVYQVYKEKYIMAQVLPEYLSEWTTHRVSMEGVICTPNTEVKDYEIKNGQLNLILTNNKTLPADQIIVAVGVEANTELADSSDLEVDPVTGGYLVNAELEARSHLWIAGDAASFYDVRLGRRRIEHHDHAVISGRLAGENMTGAGKPYLHQSMFWSDLGPEVGYEAIGIVDSTLPTVGVFAKATENDTPLAAVSASNEVMRSASEEKSHEEHRANEKNESQKQEIPNSGNLEVNKGQTSEDKPITEVTTEQCPEKIEEIKKLDDYGKGVIFYLKNDVVVGIVLWNIFNRMSIARQVLARGTKYDDLNEIAKLFTIHDD
ncbi:apoptosis-inducing factor 1, mitochondrial [Venturia canescens]|uniref:apoptosis-inducing factor 1, mitochondrial n=1 Tax=Venturia canescens TaxID=32260 RepID=UPI001C9BF502|nr:apoptosis-inducing factor 1, mitochondrial [Venturia canescens]